MFSIREFDRTDCNYQRMNNIDKAIFPEYARTIDEWHHMDATRDPNIASIVI